MSRSRRYVAVTAVAVVCLAGLLLLTRPVGLNEASSLSRRSGGLLLARRYLEARGVKCRTFTGAITKEGPPGGSLLMAFPATGARGRAELLRLRRWIRGGGTLTVLFDGSLPGPVQREMLGTLGVRTRAMGRRTELNPLRWWRQARTPWKLWSPAGHAPVLVSSGLRVALEPEPGDRTLLEAKARGAVVGLVRPVGRGRLVVVPSEVLSNGRLLEGGNAELLEWLGQRLPVSGSLAFDERLHGLGAPAEHGAEGTPVADALLVQLALIYLLAVVALARRQGPAWPQEPARGGSVGALLLRLGAVHRRMGHHADAARAMVERAAAFGGWAEIPAYLEEASRPVDGRGLIRLGREVARRQAQDR